MVLREIYAQTVFTPDYSLFHISIYLSIRVLHLTRGAPGDARRGCDFVTDAVLHSVRALTHLEDLSVAGQCQVRMPRPRVGFRMVSTRK